MRVHAGHGLDLQFAKKIRKLPFLQEVNIGHSIICYSLEWGIAPTVKKFIACLKPTK
jgi:pyridoxine 5-phosphate synthase